jgi:uncharacterized membrane protein YuzA (DUF378 family)
VTDPERPVPDAVRVQILATEHWSLLATRSTAWAEVMSRITIHLTVASAALVVLALVVQSSGFGVAFRVLSIGLCATVLILGSLTALRVVNASRDDAALLAGMNRLRAGYLDIDPSLDRYLVTSWHDDDVGILQTATIGIARSRVSHIVSSTTVFVHAVNTIVAGTLGALIAAAAGAGATLTTVVGALAGLAFLAAAVQLTRREFSREPISPRFPGS